MASSSTTDAQLRNEIARLTATINQHKSLASNRSAATAFRSNKYVNPDYKPPSSTALQPPNTAPQASTSQQVPPAPKLYQTEVKDIVLNGVAFESSGRSLVRKDLPKPPSSGPNIPRTNSQHQPSFVRKSGHLVPGTRQYKPKRIHRQLPVNRNMTLTNAVRPYRSRPKRTKFSDRPCPRFATTGACSRALTCQYQHDPSKIAICWNFLQGNCTNTADTCNLSHDPTPERTPLCLHFLNKGRCTRDDCPFPHVNVGARKGVCRDFAVLGYCTRGLDCDKQHVRECPDFAEKGTCENKGCKLPHVIRANRNRPPTAKPAAVTITTSGPDSATDSSEQQAVQVPATDAQLGDEYISLTFNESDSDSADNDESENDNDESEEDERSESNGIADIDSKQPQVL